MASNTKQTEFRRMRRARAAGHDRKKKLQNEGSTPPFAIHTEDADKNAPKEQLPADRRG